MALHHSEKQGYGLWGFSIHCARGGDGWSRSSRSLHLYFKALWYDAAVNLLLLWFVLQIDASRSISLHVVLARSERSGRGWAVAWWVGPRGVRVAGSVGAGKGVGFRWAWLGRGGSGYKASGIAVGGRRVSGGLMGEKEEGIFVFLDCAQTFSTFSYTRPPSQTLSCCFPNF